MRIRQDPPDHHSTSAQLWLGRLEFMAGFALVGFLVATVRGKG